MSYTVKKSSGSTLVTVPDRHIDRETTSIALVGYNATSYGLDHAENFVHLMEHFANDTAPENPITGQLWYDTSSNTMKVYDTDRWSEVTGTPSVGGDATQGGISGVYHCPIEADNTSVLLLFAGGKIVAVVANKDIVQANLPVAVTINSSEFVFRAIFPFGLQGGVNLADTNDINGPDDYVISGRVPLAEQTHFTGGGVDDAEVSGWGYIDIGPGKSVGLMISCGQVVAAVSSTYILNSDLPTSITFYVKKDRDTGTGTTVFTGQYKGLDANYNAVTCQVRSRFPGQVYKQWTVGSNGLPTFNPAQNINNVGLFPGLTFASAIGTNGGVNQIINSLIASQTTATTTAIATATQELKTWVDNNSATAMALTSLESTFKTATGTTSMADAVQALITMASDTQAISTAITDLKSEFNTALGTSTFSQALSKLSTAATQAGANSQSITQITSKMTDKFGGSTFAQAVDNLWTSVDSGGGAVAGWGLTLNSGGYITGIEALNGGASNNYVKITASKFIIGDNNIDFIPFQVINGVVYMKTAMIENLSIGGNKIQNGAITSSSNITRHYNGWRLNSTNLNPVGGSGNPADVVIATGSGAVKVVITAFIIYSGDGGGNDDNLNITLHRYNSSGGAPVINTLYSLPVYTGVQVPSGKRPVMFGWVDETAQANTPYIYRLTQQTLGSDGSPYWYDVTITAICFNK